MSNKRQKKFVEDGLTNDEIIKSISDVIKRRNEDEIKSLSDQDRFEKLYKEFEKFSGRYPMLFEMAVSNDIFPWDNLNYMLNMRNKIINDEMTAENASKRVGQDWYDKYVDKNKLNKKK